jgi:glycosyltransferase 2 family protein
VAEPLAELAFTPVARPTTRRWGLLAVGLAVSAGLSWLAVRNVDPQAFLRSFEASDWWYLLPSGAALVAAVAVRCLRWWLLFAAGRRPPLRAVGRAFLIGYLLNSLLPARPGELGRAVALRREARTPVAEALATTAAERVYDVLALVAFLLCAAPFLPESRHVRTATIVVGALTAVALLAAVAFGRSGARLERMVSRIPGVSLETAGRVRSGLVSLRDLRSAAVALVLTAASWLLLALSAWALLLAFHLRLGLGGAALVVAAANLALLIPASPGGVGVFEAATISVLAGFSVDRSESLSYAVALHGLNFFPYVIVGAIALQRHLSLVRDRRYE